MPSLFLEDRYIIQKSVTGFGFAIEVTVFLLEQKPWWGLGMEKDNIAETCHAVTYAITHAHSRTFPQTQGTYFPKHFAL